MLHTSPPSRPPHTPNKGILISVVASWLSDRPVAVVGSAKNSANSLIVGPLVALHHQLMSSGNEHQTIRVVELLRDILQNRAHKGYTLTKNDKQEKKRDSVI